MAPIFRSSDAPWPEEVRQRDVMRKGSGSKMLSYELISTSATALEWHRDGDPEDHVRIPKERNTVLPIGAPFIAAGRPYLSLKQLTARRGPGAYSPWYLDCYGRKVFSVWEGVPKFDSYDSGDDRGYSWFFLCEEGVLTRVFSAGHKSLYITEDVAFVENRCWEAMEEAGYLNCR